MIVPLIAAGFLAVATSDSLVNYEALYGQSVSAIVRVEGTLRGSGFITDTFGTVVTSYHVMRRAKTLTVLMANGSEYTGHQVTILAVDPVHDLALLRLGNFSGFVLPGKPLARYPGGRSIRAGRRVVALTNPQRFFGMIDECLLNKLTDIDEVFPLRRQRVTLDSYRLFVFSCRVGPGSSGGPLLDPETGAVIGVATGAVLRGVTEAVPREYPVAVPIEYVESLVQAAGRLTPTYADEFRWSEAGELPGDPYFGEEGQALRRFAEIEEERVSGYVYSKLRTPVVGAQVAARATAVESEATVRVLPTVTDANGRFELTLPKRPGLAWELLMQHQAYVGAPLRLDATAADLPQDYQVSLKPDLVKTAMIFEAVPQIVPLKRTSRVVWLHSYVWGPDGQDDITRPWRVEPRSVPAWLAMPQRGLAPRAITFAYQDIEEAPGKEVESVLLIADKVDGDEERPALVFVSPDETPDSLRYVAGYVTTDEGGAPRDQVRITVRLKDRILGSDAMRSNGYFQIPLVYPTGTESVLVEAAGIIFGSSQEEADPSSGIPVHLRLRPSPSSNARP